MEAEYLQALRDSVTLDDWRAVCQRALTDAMNGDYRAREWLGRHLLPTGADLDAEPADPANCQVLDERRLDAILEHLRTRDLVS